MRRHIHSVRDFLLPIIDFFYPPFRRLMNLQTFRYAVCGASNTALGFIVFYVSFKFIFFGNNLDFGFYVFTPYTVALVLSFCISFPFGFFLMKLLFLMVVPECFKRILSGWVIAQQWCMVMV